MRLFDIAGFAMLTLTTKKINGQFEPVGEDDCIAIIKTNEGHVVILVDEDGYTKAQTRALKKEEALEIYQKAKETGIEKFNGNEIEIWTERYSVLDAPEI